MALDWIGWNGIGLDWIGWNGIGLDWIGLDWIGFYWMEWHWIEFNWLECHWIGWDGIWIGFNLIGCGDKLSGVEMSLFRGLKGTRSRILLTLADG